MSSTLLAKLSPRRWLRTSGGALALLMLSAIPVFGIIYTSDWIILNKQTGGAPKANIVFPSDPSKVIVHMGVNEKKYSTSTVVLQRKFRVEPLTQQGSRSGESIQLKNSFATLIKDGVIQVFTSIVPVRGRRFDDNFTQNVGRNMQRLVQRSRSQTNFLTAGNYYLTITIKYVNRKGFWDNRPGSGHQFMLSSI